MTSSDPVPPEEWRGAGADAGRRLPATEYQRVKDEHTRASRAREQIDRDMSAVAARLDPSWQGGLAGTGGSLKTLASYRRKVADAREQDIEIGDAIKQHDLHRYTFTFPLDSYKSGVEGCYRRLAEGGFTRESGTNHWDSAPYKGINTVWRHHATGRQVEVQYHTPQSYEIKQANHANLEFRRSKFLPDGVTPIPDGQKRAAAWLSAQDYLKPGQECEIPADQPDWPERRVASNPPENWTEQDLAGARAGVQRFEATHAREAATDLPRIDEGAGLAGSGSSRGPPRLPEFMRRQAPEQRSRDVSRWRRHDRGFGDQDRGRGGAGR